MVALRSGSFRSLEHGTSGRAVILEIGGGRRILRFGVAPLDTT
jgi:hypothetical protein